MALLPICRFPGDSVLRQKAKKLSIFDKSLQRFIDDMIETMQASNGVGLAAPQVGVSLRVIVVQMPGEQLVAIVNPEVVKTAGEQEVTEGCLSVPGYFAEIKRPSAVTLKGKDRNGRPIRIKATGLLAEALSHEVDHLNGILHIDHVESEKQLHRVGTVSGQMTNGFTSFGGDKREL